NRAILVLERKRLVLDQEKIATLFREMQVQYQIQRVLGQGLCTAAYRAGTEATELTVVVRVLRPEVVSQPQLRARFLALGRRSARFIHQNLVLTREIRAFPDRNLYFIVRDYIEGVTLQRRLEDGREFTGEQGLTILHQVLEALTPLHREGICHGGIK